MPLPYTIEAVAALRRAEQTRTPAAEIQQLLGWDDAMLARICRKHEIDLVVCTPSTATAALPQPFFNTAPHSPHVARIISKLTTRQAEIFFVLHSHVRGEKWFSAASVRHAINQEATTGMRAISISIAGLGRRLERMGAEYRIERKKGPGGGFRLGIYEAAQ